MEKIRAWIGRVRAFLGEVQVELKKCSWPTGRELLESTMVVVVSVVLLSTFVALSDLAVIQILQAILPR
jgi:preprotein translocase SecE subunit